MNPFDGKTDEDLVAENQRLGAEQDAIRAQRLAIADELRARAGGATASGATLTASTRS